MRKRGTTGSLFRRLHADRDGVAMIEGAIISSFMVIMLVGMLELVAYFSTAVKIAEASDGIANITTLEADMSSSKVDDLGDVIALFLEPISATGTPYVVAQAVYLTDGSASLGTADGGWVEARNGMVADTSKLRQMATGLGLPGEAMIIVQIEYAYSAVLSTPFSATMPTRIVETAMAKPRIGRAIVFN
ncbi:MAG: hypothetical protein R3C97_00920 [Geminicoccaceae bacterium]